MMQNQDKINLTINNELVSNSILLNRSYSLKKEENKYHFKFAKKSTINYRNPELLKEYLSEKGRIMPSRVTGIPSKKQKLLKKAVKVARQIALLPYSK